ncbi:tetratricopeptide repeat protein [Prochlorococcus sp. AH-736-E15]|nr:tetratricopeptide repeat protein [Prochlorococcus sp. AH-736-E15]
MKGFGEKHKNHKNKKSNSDEQTIKDQIITRAFKQHSQGNIEKAKEYYENFINKGFLDHRVFCNYGMILLNLGELQKAEIFTRKAIEINPNFAMAYSNLGNIYQTIGELQKAEIFTRKAIEINPNFAMAYFNLGKIFQTIGELQKAEIFTRKAIEINPNFAMAYFNLGNIRKDLGKRKDSLDSYLRVIEINPQYIYTFNAITDLLRYSDPSQFDKNLLKKVLNLCLNKNNLSHKDLFPAFNFLYKNDLITNLEKTGYTFSKIYLITSNKSIMNALEKIIFCDPELEKVLTSFRREICNRIFTKGNDINEHELELIIGLGKQCFINEYVYSVSKEENINLQNIIERCRKGEINEINISILSCYFPLYKLINDLPLLQSFHSLSKTYTQLIQLQVKEPIKENELSKKIKKLGTFSDVITQKVKSQYEENPYPRWRFIRFFKEYKISIKDAINNEIAPNRININENNKQLKVLIAGCGTGKQILQALKYENSVITAIDLSLSSLAYAKRKLDELGINNVELVQMDILEIELLGKHFDIIECGGVLHHMDNPSKGLEILLRVLKKNGFLKLGLYSELARKEIVTARNYIREMKLKPTESNIRLFRTKIFSGEINNLNKLKISEDFFSLSQCRDLCFHAKEHRFSIQQLIEIVNDHKLTFLGFFLPQHLKNLYLKSFPKDKKHTKLENWAEFETKYPLTFSAMYQFWVCKN